MKNICTFVYVRQVPCGSASVASLTLLFYPDYFYILVECYDDNWDKVKFSFKKIFVLIWIYEINHHQHKVISLFYWFSIGFNHVLPRGRSYFYGKQVTAERGKCSILSSILCVHRLLASLQLFKKWRSNFRKVTVWIRCWAAWDLLRFLRN